MSDRDEHVEPGGPTSIESRAPLDEEPVRILAVDDSPANLRALEGLLEGVAVEVVTADSGVAALRLLMEQDFALILLDVRMPVHSGFEIAQMVRARAKSSHIPIIFLTASENTDSQVLQGYALGAVDFLLKPIVPEILLSKVQVFIDLHRQNRDLKRQAELLREAEHREHEHRLEELRKRADEERLRREIDLERRLSEERAQAINARDEFISIASHELRTPLTPLTLRVQALRQSIEAGDKQQLLDSTAKIESYVRRLTRLVDTLLDVSRVTHGKLELQPGDVELRELLDDVLANLDGEITRSGSTIEISGLARARGRWDRLRLEQVFTNLLSNAIKYGLGKPIELQLKNGPDGYVEVRVSDHGIGIAPEDQGRVFERFERAVPPTHFGGFGLGLWIVRHLVEAHGGSIALESAASGTTIVIRLPVNR